MHLRFHGLHRAVVFCGAVRIFVIPHFKTVPGKFQLLLEELVGFFDNLAKTNSPHRNTFLGGYIFAAGVYIFIGTLFELFGFQAITAGGLSVPLPTPLSDINAAIALGCLSYLVIMSGGIAGDGIKGNVLDLRDTKIGRVVFGDGSEIIGGSTVRRTVETFEATPRADEVETVLTGWRRYWGA